MNGKNFDSLKNLKAPQEWIDNALKIPATQEKKPIFFVRYSRHLMAVACLVLVCTISLIVVLNRDDNVLIIDPDHKTHQTETTQSQDETSDTKPDKTDYKNNQVNPTDSENNTNGDAPHESTENRENPTEKDKDDNKKPTKAPQAKPTTQTDSKEESTDAPESTPRPTVKPTRPPSVKPTTKPLRPTEGGIIYPTENTPSDPGSPGYPTKPGAPGTPPDDTPSNPSGSTEFSAIVGRLSASETVYCTVEDSHGNTVVYNTPASFYSNGDYSYVYVYISNYNFPTKGSYTCYFYNSYGYYITSSTAFVS